MDIDPRFRDEFVRVLERNDLLDLDGLMTYHGYLDELPLYALYAEVAFLDHLPADERNRTLISAAVAHLSVILDHSRQFYAGRGYDYFCAVTVTNWDFVEEEGAPVVPHFWYANPSHGVFHDLGRQPPTSEQSRFVAACLDHSPDYVLSDDIVPAGCERRLERVWIEHLSCPAPTKHQPQGT